MYPIPMLHEMHEAGIEASHSFWYIKLVSKDKREMFYGQFDNTIAVD